MFKNLDIKGRWIAAKRAKLCYRCLGGDHLGTECQRWRICNIRGYKEKHRRLLHKGEVNKTDGFAGTTLSTVQQVQHQGSMEGESGEVNQQRTMVKNSDEEYISLRTVPVILKNGEKSVVVNALLDDGSTQTYLNSDVAAELGLEGKMCDTQANVLNGCVESFQTMPVSVKLMSLFGQVSMKVDAFTVTRVTGNMKSINWVKNKQGWKHLKGIKFAVPSKRVILDMLIGIDYPDLH